VRNRKPQSRTRPTKAIPPPPDGVPEGTEFTVREKLVKCGKADCPCAKEGGQRHGPYLYRVWRQNGKVRSQYLGKRPAAAPAGKPSGKPPVALKPPVEKVVPVAPHNSLPASGVPATPSGHPRKIGDTVRFGSRIQLGWYRRDCTNKLRKDRPKMVVDGVGWALGADRKRVYPFVTLVLPGGEVVYHAYNAAFTGYDPAGVLDRRFPVALLAGG